jgi:hypothetical protein
MADNPSMASLQEFADKMTRDAMESMQQSALAPNLAAAPKETVPVALGPEETTGPKSP